MIKLINEKKREEDNKRRIRDINDRLLGFKVCHPFCTEVVT